MCYAIHANNVFYAWLSLFTWCWQNPKGFSEPILFMEPLICLPEGPTIT